MRGDGIPTAEVFRVMQIGLNAVYPVERPNKRRRCRKDMTRMLAAFREAGEPETVEPGGVVRINPAVLGPLLMQARCGACARKCKSPPK